MDAVIVALAVGVLSAAMMAPGSGLGWALAALSALTLAALFRRSCPAVHVALFGLLWTAIAFYFPGSRVWPTKLVAPLGAYAVLVVLLVPLRRSVGWLRAGRVTPRVWRWIGVTVAVSSAALVAWTELTDPDLGIHLANIPAVPRWTFPLAAVVFAAGNAALEEAVFRGIVMQALDETLGAGPMAILLQALCFGAAHYVAGFPNGMLGFLMACAYGAMLGGVRRISDGLLGPWFAHVAADLTIFAILAAVIVNS